MRCSPHVPATKSTFFTILGFCAFFSVGYAIMIGFGVPRLPSDQGVALVVAGSVGLANAVGLALVCTFLWTLYEPEAGESCHLPSWILLVFLYVAGLIAIIIVGALQRSGATYAGLVTGGAVALVHVPLFALLFCVLAGMAVSRG